MLRKTSRHRSEPQQQFPSLSTVLRRRRQVLLPLPHFTTQNVAPDNAVTLGYDPAVPIVSLVPVVDPLLRSGRFDSLSVLPCPASRCPTSCRWYLCLLMLWTGGLWNHHSSTLLSCVRICLLLRFGSRHSTSRGHQYL